MDRSSHDRGTGGPSAFGGNVVSIGFLLAGGFLLVTAHRATPIAYLGYLPFLLIVASLLLHLIVSHGGHEDDEGRNYDDGSSDGPQNAPPRQHQAQPV
jgi:hypothetical protein